MIRYKLFQNDIKAWYITLYVHEVDKIIFIFVLRDYEYNASFYLIMFAVLKKSA
jgi:hypothetical protein